MVCKFKAAVKGRVSGTELMQQSEVVGKAEAGAHLENLIGCVLNKRQRTHCLLSSGLGQILFNDFSRESAMGSISEEAGLKGLSVIG